MPRTSPIHYINPAAISITPNVNNSSNDIEVFIAQSTKIKVFCPRLGIGNSNGAFNEWTIIGRNRRLAESDRPYTIYARLNKNNKTDGYLVFAPKQQFENEWYDKYSYVTKDGLGISYVEGRAGGPSAVDDGTYWYVKLGDVSNPSQGTNQRTVNLDTGILGTDFWNSEWALNPDALPLRIDMNYMLGTILGEEWTADVRYVRWEQVLHVNAKLIEGWTGTDITHFHHWEITRNTGSDADAEWNAAHDGQGEEEYNSTDFDLTLVHTRGQGDDFNGRISALFTFTAYEANPEYEEDTTQPQYLPLIAITFSVMAEPVESYELEVSSETVTYNPQTGEYVPAIEYNEQTHQYSVNSGVTVRIKAKDADGNTFYPTDEQIEAIGLHVYCHPIDDPLDSSHLPTLLSLVNGRSTLPSAPFIAGKGVNTWLQVGEWSSSEDNIILTQRTTTYIRFGAKGDTPINCYRWYKEGLTPKKPTATNSDEPAPASGDATGEGNVYPTDKWSATIPNRPATGEWLLWMCSSIRHGDNTRDAWSGPVCISGTKGEPGADAEDREYIYKRLTKYPFNLNTGETEPANITKDTSGTTRTAEYIATHDDFVPLGWSDTAMPATSSEKYVYISIRIKEPGQQWGPFSSPVLWTNWGVQGADGDGVQYVYKLFDHELTDAERTSNIPTKPSQQNASGEWLPISGDSNWYDDPQAPTSSMPYCYCSVIKRLNGTWGNYEKLGLWSKWAKDGASITKQSEEYRYAVTIDTTQPTDDGSSTGSAETAKWYESKDRVLPLWTAGRYFWTKTIITWSDDSKTNLYSSERNPNDGQPGQDIIVDGATVMKYAVSDSNAVRPTQWFYYDNIKSQIVPGKWLWSQATTNYKKADGSGSAGSSVNYNVSYIGTDGENAQYIYLKGTARDINSDVLTTIPCEIKTNGGDSLLTTIQRGLNLVTINRQTLAKVEEAHYDTYGEAVGSQQALNPGITDLIARLNSLDDSVFVCLVSFDAIGWQRPADVTAGTYPLITALQGYGMSDLPYTAAGRYPFLFIGYKNLGKGNGHTRMRNIGAYTDVVELAAYVANGALTLKDGKDGKDGRSIVRVTEYYKASNLDGSDAQHSETAPADGQESAQGWSTDPNLADKPAAERWNEANKYLWNYEKVEYSSGVTVERTTPQILAIWTKDGAAGRGIDTIVNKYKVTDSNDTPPDREHEGGTGWRNSPVAPGQGQYLWNYEIITWVNGTPPTTYTDVQQIGYAGEDGQNMRENLIDHSEPKSTTVISSLTELTRNNDYHHYGTTDKTYDPAKIPANGSKVSGQARVTLQGCSFKSNVSGSNIKDGQYYGHMLLYFQTNASWPRIVEFDVYDNGVYDVVAEDVTVNSNGGEWTGQVMWRVDNFEHNSGTISFERVKLEVGDRCSGWCLSENDKRITKKSETPYYIKNSTGARPAENDPTWSTTKPTLGQGEWLFTKTVILWSDGSTTVLYTDERNPKDGVAGMDIVAGTTTIQYAVANNNTQQPTEWHDYAEIVSQITFGKWLWTKATTPYYKGSTSGDSAGSSTNYSVSYIGTNGTNGRALTASSEHYNVSDSSTTQWNVPSSGTWANEWTTNPNVPDQQGNTQWNKNHRYLWNYEKLTYTESNGTTTIQRTTPRVVAIWTEDGKGIDTVVNYYAINNDPNNAPPANQTGAQGWDDDPIAPNATYPYLWNYEVIYWTDGTDTAATAHASAHVIGHFGKDADVWTIEEGQDGEYYWYKNGVKYTDTDHPNGIVAEGKNGTGVEIKGGVDVLFNADKTSASQTSLEGLTGVSVGECYTVTANKHLYFYDGTTAASAANPSGWRDLGKFSGEDGQSSYMHIAYADNVTFDAQGHPVSCTGFTVTKQKEAYDWVGLRTNNSQTDPTTYTEYEWNKVKGAKGEPGDDAVYYTIVFTDKTFALDPNTNKNVVSIKGAVYKTEGNNIPTKVTVSYASHFAMRFVKSDGTTRELSSGTEFGIQDGGFVTYFGNGDTSTDYKTFIVEYKPDGQNILAQDSLALTVYGEKGMDAIRGYVDYLYSRDDQGNYRPAASANLLGKIDLLSYYSDSHNRIAICEMSGSSYTWKEYGKDTYPNGTMFVCKVDNHIYRASANGWVDEGRFKGDNAVVYKIDFTDSTFAYNPNTAKNVVDVRGVVYKIDGGNTSVFTSLGTDSSLELYFLRTNPVSGQPPIQEQIPANLVTISNGAFSTNSQNGASDRGEMAMLAIVKIGTGSNAKEVTRANIPRGLYGTDGEPGSRGKRGRSYYYAQPWQDNYNVSYLVNDSVAPYFYFEDDGEYYVYNPVGDVNDSISMHDMGTPSTSNPNWEKMQSKFKYLITEAIFGKFADFGDFIINGSWLFAEIGMFLGESTEDHPTHTHNIYDFRNSPTAEEVTMPVHAFLHPEDPTISFVNRYDDSESGSSTIDDVTTEPECVIVDSSQQEVWLSLKKDVLYSFQANYTNCEFYLRKEGSSIDLSLMGKQGKTTGITYFQVAENGNYKFMVERYASNYSATLSWVRFSEHYFLANIAINGKTGYILQRDSHGNYNGNGYFEHATIKSAEVDKMHSGTAYDANNPAWLEINGKTFDISRYSKVRVVEWNSWPSGYVKPLGYVYIENGVLKVSSIEREFYNPNGNPIPAN